MESVQGLFLTFFFFFFFLKKFGNNEIGEKKVNFIFKLGKKVCVVLARLRKFTF